MGFGILALGSVIHIVGEIIVFGFWHVRFWSRSQWNVKFEGLWDVYMLAFAVLVLASGNLLFWISVIVNGV